MLAATHCLLEHASLCEEGRAALRPRIADSAAAPQCCRKVRLAVRPLNGTRRGHAVERVRAFTACDGSEPSVGDAFDTTVLPRKRSSTVRAAQVASQCSEFQVPQDRARTGARYFSLALASTDYPRYVAPHCEGRTAHLSRGGAAQPQPLSEEEEKRRAGGSLVDGEVPRACPDSRGGVRARIRPRQVHQKNSSSTRRSHE